jgi:hypothetical protein
VGLSLQLQLLPRPRGIWAGDWEGDRRVTHLYLARRHVQMLGELLPQLSPGALFQRKDSLEEDHVLGLQHPARARGAVVAYPQ